MYSQCNIFFILIRSVIIVRDFQFASEISVNYIGRITIEMFSFELIYT